MFEKKGMITVPSDRYAEDELMEIMLEAGAEDMGQEGELYEIYTAFEDFHQVRNELEGKDIAIESAETTMIPQNTIKLEGKNAEQLMKLMNILDDHDDVQNVYANFDIEDAEMERILAE